MQQVLLEHRPELIALAADERIWGVARRLLGEGFVYVGSEGNVSSLETFNWHSDRKYYNHPNFAAAGDPSLLPPHFTQLKLMLYLEELGPENGCLNCIVGSHKSPLHEAAAVRLRRHISRGAISFPPAVRPSAGVEWRGSGPRRTFRPCNI